MGTIEKIEEVYRVTFTDGTVEYFEKVVPSGEEKPDPDGGGGDDGEIPMWVWAVTSTELTVRDVPSLGGNAIWTVPKDTVFEVKGRETVDGDLWVWRETRMGYWIQELNLITDERVLSIGVPGGSEDGEWEAVVVSSYVNTREKPNRMGEVKQLKNGSEIVVRPVSRDAEGYDGAYVWWEIKGPEDFAGRYVAERSVDGTQVFLKVDRGEDTPETFYGTLQPKQHPLVEVDYEGRRYVVHHWNKKRASQETGWNGRRWAHTISDVNGDPRLVGNGFRKAHLIEEIAKQNAPGWNQHPHTGGLEPIYNSVWRSIAANVKLSNAQIVSNYLEVLQLLHQYYRDGDGNPYIRLDICIMDALGGLWPNCSFKGYIDAGYHEGGRLGTRFMREEAWLMWWKDLARNLIDGIGSHPEYLDLVARMTPLNEFASSEKPSAEDVAVNRNGLLGMIRHLWEKSEGMWATGPGWATSYHICQDSEKRGGMSQIEFIRAFFNPEGDGKYCTTNEVHLYCKKPSENPMLTPAGAHQDWQHMYNDIVEVLTNENIKRAVWQAEGGTWFDEAYVPGLPARDELWDWSARYCMHDLGTAVRINWGTELKTNGTTLGEGDNSRGLVQWAQRGVDENYEVVSTPGVVLKNQGLAKDNYQRSLKFKIIK